MWPPPREIPWLAGHLRELREAVRLGETRHSRGVDGRASTQELFFRWALVSGSATRAALWKLAARTGEGPLTEEMFEADMEGKGEGEF